MSLSRQRLDNMKLGALRNPFTPVWQAVAAGRLVVEYRPISNPVTGRIDKRKTREAVAPELLYVYSLASESDQVVSLVREADVLALLDGEALETVQARRERDAGDVFQLVQKALWAEEVR